MRERNPFVWAALSLHKRPYTQTSIHTITHTDAHIHTHHIHAYAYAYAHSHTLLRVGSCSSRASALRTTFSTKGLPACTHTHTHTHTHARTHARTQIVLVRRFRAAILIMYALL
jgi:hypothetical protein